MTALSDTQFRQLCENLAFILVAVDRELRVCFCNEQACLHFDEPADRLLGKEVLLFIPESQRGEVRRLLREALDQGRAGELELKWTQPDGGKRTFVLIASPVVDEAGGRVAVSICMRDISLRKQLSQELARSRRMASLGKMAAGVAHHFNNILGGMMTSIDFALASDSAREQRKTLQLLAQAIGRATRITHQLAAFAASENQQVAFVDLTVLLVDFIKQLTVRSKPLGVAIETRIGQVQPCAFESQRLLSILESIAQNALDAMGGGGTLSIELAEENDEAAVITLGDTGGGMSEEVQDHLFEPFYTTKGELGGGSRENIGLGLAAVHGLVSEMGGTISIQSQVGVGTTVRIRLPLSRSLSEQPA